MGNLFIVGIYWLLLSAIIIRMLMKLVMEVPHWQHLIFIIAGFIVIILIIVAVTLKCVYNYPDEYFLKLIELGANLFSPFVR
jgi:hypothetical protein